MIRRQKDVLLNRNHSVRFKVHLLQMPLPASALVRNEEDTEMGQRKCIESKGSNFACRIRDHVKMGPKFSETVKSKLSLGAKIIQKGGRENIFKQIFGLTEGEEFLKASQCYLSTTRGPIAGLLFISNKKIAFCSERSISYSSSTGELIRTPYKVLIPIQKIKSINESENVNKPEQKYVEIVTVDDFEFWFMGFLRYEKAYRNLQKAISMANEM
ncbi:putative GEM-like protein 8 [Citrus sinensis]|uniref:GEM-like protein 8 n=2 Tax=Citrus sinensis TaxID=2711 RepID=A0ACB8M5T9_CITSI|nr:putative GEM-like protein 8 [Citrus sinensis]KAH9781025.1 putative GEM-like protein 8 [Citrus sinensis]